jgi:large subunit ribosomal protein L25
MARRELNVETRQVKGKKVAQLRRGGILPANLYGHGLESVAVQAPSEDIEKTLKAASANEVLDLKIAGEKDARPVVIQRIQRHPLNSGLLHLDFYQVSLRQKMRADVPLVIVGQSEAIETFNGVLVQAIESVHVEALPLDLPSRIEVDISPLSELEMSIHVRDLPVPANVTLLTDEEVVVAKVAAPRIAQELEEEEAAAAAAAAEEEAEAAEGEEAEPTAEAEAGAEAESDSEEKE